MAAVEKTLAAHTSPPLPTIVEAMMQPAFYPEAPEKVELIQTHISYVFIAGAFVYKLKKAVRFSFIDCSDLGQRRLLCAEEIRLNRRLAPDVYLGIYPVVRVGSDFVLGEQSTAHGQAVDYVLKMRRLPDDRMLDRRLARDEVDHSTIRALASVIVDFYRTTSSARASRYGVASELWRLIIGELIDVERLVGVTLTAKELPIIENYCRGFIASHWKMLNARVDAGRVREGHGDLRCEHICLEEGKFAIFDCVEFSERLRTCDIASEVAFLAMDLDRLGAQDLADELVGAVAEMTQDEELSLLMPFYKCYRAIIRGVVETLRSRQVEIEDSERKSASALARKYFSLARNYAIDAAPAMIVVCGLSGTGKSTVAQALRNRFGFPIISSDRTRKKLAAIPIERHAADAYKAGIYADAITESTYATMLDDAGHLLRDTTGVVLDATYQDPSHRKAALDLAARQKVKILFIECRADDAEIRRRLIERRKTGNNPSDATVEVYLRQRADFAALAEIPASSHLIVDTARPIDEIVSAAKNAMERLSI
jgi:aminoglycoside phosphotransferase family enzyme/predicted kinase